MWMIDRLAGWGGFWSRGGDQGGYLCQDLFSSDAALYGSICHGLCVTMARLFGHADTRDCGMKRKSARYRKKASEHDYKT